MSDIANLGVRELVAGMASKDFKCQEVVESFLSKIDEQNSKINAVVAINEKAVDLAKKIDQTGTVEGRLGGLPLGIKDLFCTKGLESTACSRMLKGFVPPYTATCVEALEKEGAFVLAKLNMDEFAMGSSNETSAFGPCKNPWDLDKVPGGSSGGSAAAVASRMVPVALGSDTGGSIRQPAHFCGITGIKPTYGSISRFGMMAFASSLDQAGPMGRSVEDCAFLLDLMVSQDLKDGTTRPRKMGSLRDIQPKSLKGVRFGFPKEYMSLEVSSDIAASFEKVKAVIESSGGNIVEVSLPNTEHAVATYYLVATSEASSNLSRYDGIRYGYRAQTETGQSFGDLDSLYRESRSKGFGSEVQRRIMLGTFALSAGHVDAFYKKACQVRRRIFLDFSMAFDACDFLISPVATTPAFGIGERIENPLKMFANDVFTTSASLAGIPAMSLPHSLTAEGLPMGLQIMAPSFEEKALIEHAMTLEQNFDFQGGPHVR